MGMPKQVIKLLKQENMYKKFSGDALFCGRQSVLADRDTITNIFSDIPEISKQLLDKWKDLTNLDDSTRHGTGLIRDDVFLKTLFDVTYNCVDISDYEGANIICDLNYPVSNELMSKFDLIFTGGCLDNVFNPVSLLMNSTKLLKTGGRVIHYETFSGVMGAYLGFSPEWFYSYYAINSFADCKVYVCHQTEAALSRFTYDTHLFSYHPNFTRNPNPDYFKAATASAGIMYVMVIAEKSEESTAHLMPSQLQYLNNKSVDWTLASSKFDSTTRPIVSVDFKTKNYDLPFLSDHYTYLGSNF